MAIVQKTEDERLLLSFQDFLLLERELASLSIKAYLSDIKLFFNFLKAQNLSLTKFSNEHIQAYLKEKVELDSRSVARFLCSLRTYCQFLIKQGIRQDDPAALIDNPRLAKTLPHTLSEEAVSLILEAPDLTTHVGLRDKAMLETLYATGLRVSELVNLKFENIDWRKNEIRIIQHKTKRMHVIPLLPEIGNPIIEYIKRERRSSSKYVFTTEKGQKLNTYMITYIVNTYFSNAPFDLKGRHYGPHTLRHSIATNLINNSVSAFSVANVLGHSNTNCIQIYAKVDMEGLKKCVLEVPYRV